MTDSHTHIGQFKEVYYDPLEVVDTVMSAGLGGLSFSSTTSCKEGVEYREVEQEIAGLLSRISYNTETLRPFFWHTPDYIDQQVTLESALGAIPYKGIKIHPLAHCWDFENARHMEALHGLFDCAAQKRLPVLVHTGHSGVDSADRFERFFAEYPGTPFILAHCRPLDITIKMLNTYANVCCDTAFVPNEDIQTIINCGYKEKIIFGTDFPITHYYKTKYPQNAEDARITLREQYAIDIQNCSSTYLVKNKDDCHPKRKSEEKNA